MSHHGAATAGPLEPEPGLVVGGPSEDVPRQFPKVPAGTRIDPAHRVAADSTAGLASSMPGSARSQAGPSPEQLAAMVDLVSQVRTQAAQLSGHLARRQADLDRREAELQAHAALLDQDTRAARTWLDQKRQEIDARRDALAEAEGKLREETARLEVTVRQQTRDRDECMAEAAARTRALTGREAELNLLIDEWGRANKAVKYRQEHGTRLVRQVEAHYRRLELVANALDQSQAKLTATCEQWQRLQAAWEADRAQALDRLAGLEQTYKADLIIQQDRLERQAADLAQREGRLTAAREAIGRRFREALVLRLAALQAVDLMSDAPPAASQVESLRCRLAEHDAATIAEIRRLRRQTARLLSALDSRHRRLLDEHGRQQQARAAANAEFARRERDLAEAREAFMALRVHEAARLERRRRELTELAQSLVQAAKSADQLVASEVIRTHE